MAYGVAVWYPYIAKRYERRMLTVEELVDIFVTDIANQKSWGYYPSFIQGMKQSVPTLIAALSDDPVFTQQATDLFIQESAAL